MQGKWYDPPALAIYGVLAAIVCVEGYLLFKTGEATVKAYDVLLNPVRPRRRKKTARGKTKKTTRSTRK